MRKGVHLSNLLIFVFCFACLFVLQKASSAADTLTPTQSILDGQELASSGQIFTLGFFSPGSSNNRYIGIWYTNKTPQTVVWVANREKPLNDSRGNFTIGTDGKLALFDREDNIVWSSTSSRPIQEPIAKLLDSGNLVLIDGKDGDSSIYAWQSFDYPTDTMLPGMRIGWDKNSGLNRYLTSWNSANDPSQGNFTYTFDHVEFPEIVVRKGSIIKFRTGIWNGVQFNGEDWTTSFTAFKLRKAINNNEVLYWNEPGDRLSRLVLTYDGQAQRYIWDYQHLQWTNFDEASIDFCYPYGVCGPNGMCDINNVPTFCNCLKGFKPKSQEEWIAFNWSGGCTRRTPLNCTQGDKFEKLSWVKLPMLLQFWTQDSMSLEECQVKCLNNCSCTAYAYSALNGGPHGCLIWFGDLVDMRLLKTREGPQQDLYVRLAASEVGEESNPNSSKRKVAVVAISVSLALVLFCSILYIAKKFKERKVMTANLGHGNQSEEQALPLFDMLTILAATNHFSKENQVGEGGFGSVYKGKMAGGQEIAVKRLSKTSKQGIQEFKNEVGLVAKLQHRNLVKVLGGCVHGEERMLVYEYMPNKSLDHFIFDPKRGNLLNWRKRYEIIKGIARGLLYLHQDSRLTIIHRDLKTSNILLDNDLLPKISDFGLAHIVEGDHSAVKAKSIAGTYGYIAPEYAIHGLFSPKSDVFSFGVIVLEMLSGSKNSRYRSPNHHHNLLGQAWILWKEGRPLEFMDVSSDLTTISIELIKCLQIGLLCVQKFPKDRPTMLSVIFMLSNECMSLPEPKLPGFFMEDFCDSSRVDFCSNNVMTISLLEARN